MSEYYVTQERAMAPGIAGEWPDVIMHPKTKNGRLKRSQAVKDVIERADRAVKEWRNYIEDESAIVFSAGEHMVNLEKALAALDGEAG